MEASLACLGRAIAGGQPAKDNNVESMLESVRIHGVGGKLPVRQDA
jgi:hypothetical protein